MIDVEDILNRALEADAGKGTLLEFETTEGRERTRFRFYGRKSAEHKRSFKLPLDDPMYDMDPWAPVMISRVGTHRLWIGCPDEEGVNVLEGVACPND